MILMLMSTSTQSAAAAEPGVVPDLTWSVSDADKQRTIAAIRDVGSKWVRLSVQWRDAEPADDGYDGWWLAEYRKAIDMARAAGQRVIVVVDNAPAWASGSEGGNVARDPADYAEFMQFLVSRFRGKVDAWEVWNEPNLQRFWSSGPNPGDYARLLRAAYPAIKAGDPNAKVVFGGVSGNDYSFLEGAYAAGAKGNFDVMATHPYTYCGSSGPADVRHGFDGRISRDSFLGYREVRATMAARGDAKPIWFTEFGWNTSSTSCDPGAGIWQGGVTEAKQADHLYHAFKMIEADPYVQVALWYNFRGNYWENDGDSPEARYGLLRTDFSPKPAYGAFKAFATGEGWVSASPSPGGGRPGKKGTKTKLRADVKPRTDSLRVDGRVQAAEGGQVTIVLERLRGGRWKQASADTVRLRNGNAFRRTFNRLRQGAIRVHAIYRGSDERAASRSRYLRLRMT